VMKKIVVDKMRPEFPGFVFWNVRRLIIIHINTRQTKADKVQDHAEGEFVASSSVREWNRAFWDIGGNWGWSNSAINATICHICRRSSAHVLPHVIEWGLCHHMVEFVNWREKLWNLVWISSVHDLLQGTIKLLIIFASMDCNLVNEVLTYIVYGVHRADRSSRPLDLSQICSGNILNLLHFPDQGSTPSTLERCCVKSSCGRNKVLWHHFRPYHFPLSALH
jgi:hypothetical protein